MWTCIRWCRQAKWKKKEDNDTNEISKLPQSDNTANRRAWKNISIDSHTVNAAHMVSFAWALHVAVNMITQNKHRHSLISSYTEQIWVNCTNSQRALKKNHVTWYFFIIYCNLGGWSKWKHHFMWCDSLFYVKVTLCLFNPNRPGHNLSPLCIRSQAMIIKKNPPEWATVSMLQVGLFVFKAEASFFT